MRRRAIRSRAVAADVALMIQGRPSEGIFCLEVGRIRVEVEGPAGEKLRLRTKQAGTIVGEISLYLGTPCSATVVAESECVVHQLPPSDLAALLDEAPAAAAALHYVVARLLAERVVTTTEAVLALHR